MRFQQPSFLALASASRLSWGFRLILLDFEPLAAQAPHHSTASSKSAGRTDERCVIGIFGSYACGCGCDRSKCDGGGSFPCSFIASEVPNQYFASNFVL